MWRVVVTRSETTFGILGLSGWAILVGDCWFRRHRETIEVTYDDPRGLKLCFEACDAVKASLLNSGGMRSQPERKRHLED
jgi:hypothetical protein